YGRMDADELATPGYGVLTPAIRTRLATLEKGQLMVRHPHFTQPIFVRFPRPAVMRGRDGAEKYPQAEEVGFEVAVLRDLRRLDPSLELSVVQDAVALHDEQEVIRARNATMRARPAAVKDYFLSQLRTKVSAREARAPEAPANLRRAPSDDPYGF